MTIYGVEDELVISDYRFQIGYDSDNEVGLSQRDVWVAHRRSVESMAPTDFTGPQLLEAYRGADRDTRCEGFARQIGEVRQQYKEARRVPHANSNRLLRQEKKAIRNLEHTLTQELSTLDRDLFDLDTIAAQVQQFEQGHFLRSFYFDEANDRYMRNFCRKYATDPAYREDVSSKRAHWVERNALFVKNLARATRWDPQVALSSEADELMFELKQEQFFRWICQHHKAIIALPEYQRIKELDNAFDSTCGEIDPGIAGAVLAWNALPGIVTKSSCQGVSGEVSYAGETILVATQHEEFAYIEFALLDEAVNEAIEQSLPAFPAIHLGTFERVLALGETTPRKYRRLQSTGDNVRFRSDIAVLADTVQRLIQR